MTSPPQGRNFPGSELFGNLPQRYQRLLRKLGDSGLPFYQDAGHGQLGALVFQGHTASRAIVLVVRAPRADIEGRGESFVENVTVELPALLASIVRKCQWHGIDHIELRCPVSQWAPESFEGLPSNWTEMDRVQFFYRSNMQRLDRQISWLRQDFLFPLANNLKIVPWSYLFSARSDQCDLSHCRRCEIDVEDLDLHYSHALISRTSETESAVVGWMLVTRRRRGLLYKQLYLTPQFRGIRNLAGTLIAAAVLRQFENEPNTGIAAKVRRGNDKVARLFRQLFRQEAEEVEDHWVSFFNERVVSSRVE